MLRRKWKAAVSLSLLLIFLAGGVWKVHAPLLREIARIWVISDPPQQADAIVILGGGVETRPEAAARLYHQGFALRILIMQPNPLKIERMGLVIDEVAITKKYLELDHVPTDAIQLLEPNVTNTFDEARALADWARDHRARRILIPTDLFHARRARWIMQRQLQALNTDIRMIPMTYAGVEADNWWENDRGFSDFQKETLKFAFYRLRF